MQQGLTADVWTDNDDKPFVQSTCFKYKLIFNTYLMRQTVHLFIGNDLTIMGEAVANHTQDYGINQQIEFTHFVGCTNVDGVLSLRKLKEAADKISITTDNYAIWYFEELYGQTITIDHSEKEKENCLFLTIYVQLYNKEDVDTCLQLQKWVAKCNKPFDINVIGISYELASLYCASEGERKLLVEKVQEYKDRTKDSIKRLMTLRNEINSNDGQIFSGATSVLRLFLFQNCNEEGRGLNLDKNTLIKILGEYSILVSVT